MMGGGGMNPMMGGAGLDEPPPNKSIGKLFKKFINFLKINQFF